MVIALALAAQAHTAVVWPVEPGGDWCRVVNEVAAPGDIVELPPGRWRGGCRIVRGGIPEKNESTLIRSADPDDRAVIEAVDGGPIITFAATHVRLYDLELDGLDRVGPLLQVEAGSITIDRCALSGPGRGVVGESALPSIFLLNNTFETGSPAWSLGCPDGSCAIERGTLRNNLVLGAGVVLTGSKATYVFDNVVAPTTGAAFTLRGAAILRRNLAWHGGITLEGGPYEVDSTVVWDADVALDGAAAASVLVRGATLDGEVVLGPDAHSEAVAHRGGWSGPAGDEVVDCSAGGCFRSVWLPDLRPLDGGPLAVATTGPGEDFCQAGLASIGALGVAADTPQWLGPEAKETLCSPKSVPPEPSDTGLLHTGDTGGVSSDTGSPGVHTGDTGAPPRVTTTPSGTSPVDSSVAMSRDSGGRTAKEQPVGCGCGHAPRVPWWLVLLPAGLRRRRCVPSTTGLR